jgi:CRISPR-associated protein Cas2
LRKVARSLEGFGARLQYSVFECPLDDLRLAKLKAELEGLLNHDEDQVLFVSLGPSTNDASLIIEAMGLPYEMRSRVTII